MIKIFYDRDTMFPEANMWIGFHSCYIYTHKTLLGLLWVMLTEWKQDRHMIG